MIKQLDRPPISGQYEEVIFDLQEQPCRGKNWHYVLFTTSQGQEWCGHFRERDINNFLTSELKEINIACIVSGGHGFIIDIDKKEKIMDVGNGAIISLAADNAKLSFIFATYWNIFKVDKDFNYIDFILPTDADGIILKEIKDRKLYIEIEEIGAEMKINSDYYLDLNEDKIMKRFA